MIQKTPFYAYHIALGAKMAPFAGYEMPISYEGIIAEHNAVRNNVGMFDVSHMGEFIVRGNTAAEFLNYVTSNDILKLEPGKVQYTCMPNDKNGIIDDLLVYNLSENVYMLVVNASNIEKDWNWLIKHKPSDIQLENISEKTALLAVQGINAANVLQTLTEINLNEMPYYTFKKGVFANCENVLISATGYTGAGGFEIYFDIKYADKIWQAIMSNENAPKPCGLGARDTLRLEKAFCLYGNDIDDTTNTLEAGLAWITKFNKTFIQKENLLEQKKNGLQRKLVGFEMVERGIPRHDYIVCDAEGNEIGRVTSGTQSPSLQKAIGLAYVKTSYSAIDSVIYVKIRDQSVKAKVVKTPFL
jgi:aminomethyltransferase